MNFKTILAPAVALTMALANPLQAKAEITPAERVTASMSMTLCLMEYGRTQETAQWFFEAGVSQYPEQTVMNIMNHSEFHGRVRKHIQASGGCGALVELIQGKAAEAIKTRGI